MKILFDTDPGIDDAMALLMLARDPRAELVGITTVFGNAPIDITTGNALALCERFGIEVPVARGAGAALRRPGRGFPVEIHGDDGIGDVWTQPPRRRREEAESAASFICRMARLHAGELTIVAVGPLTNLALALQLDPSLVERVRSVVLMGGAFGTDGHRGNASPVAEANLFNDPDAADAVVTARWPVTLVGLDVTHQVLLDNGFLDELGARGGDEGAFIRDITRLYERFYRRRTGGGIYSHDASAVACALEPALFRMRCGPVRVVTEGIAAGESIQAAAGDIAPAGDWHGFPAQRVCIGVDADQVRSRFRECFVR